MSTSNDKQPHGFHGVFFWGNSGVPVVATADRGTLHRILRRALEVRLAHVEIVLSDYGLRLAHPIADDVGGMMLIQFCLS